MLCIEVCVYLKVGYPHRRDHAKHNEEHASDDRVWDGDEDGPELSEDPQDDHEDPSRLEDKPAANLAQREHRGSVYNFLPCQLYYYYYFIVDGAWRGNDKR